MISKERIKPGTVIKIKTWEEIKKVHNNELNENTPSHKSLCEFLKSHAGKKRTVFNIQNSHLHNLRVYIKEDDSSMYFLLKEIASVHTGIELNDNLFEL